MGMICVGDKKIADTTPDLTPYALQENVDNEFENVVYKTDISKNITSDSTDTQVASAKAVFTGLANKPEIDDDDEGESELTVWSSKKTSNKIAEKVDKTDIATTISSASTDSQVPSAKVTWDALTKGIIDATILATVDEVNSFDRAYQCFMIPSTISEEVGLPISPFKSSWFCIHLSHSHGNRYPSQIAFEYAGAKRIMYRVSVNGVWISWQELATMDKVVKDSRTAIVTLYNNSTGDFLKSDMNLTATKSGILKVSFNKKETGNTFNIYINDIHKYAYPNWWGENIYETAYIPVNNGDEIRISTDVSVEEDYYRIVNVLII